MEISTGGGVEPALTFLLGVFCHLREGEGRCNFFDTLHISIKQGVTDILK